MKISSILFLLALALAVLFWGGGTAAAAAPQITFTVNSTVDAPDAQPGNGVCETAIGNGICTLRAAIREANAHPGADIIHLPAGTYKLTRVGVDDTALNGDLDITDSLGIYGVGAANTIIDGNGAVSHDRVLHIRPGAVVSAFDVSIVGGAGPGGGGGILNSGVLTLTNSNVSNNLADWDGGGIANGGALTLTNSTVSNNLAENSGGGISTQAAASKLTLADTTVSGNQAGNDGGGIDVYGSELSLTNTTISGNRAKYDGGGIRLYTGFLSVTNTTISGNYANGYAGGIAATLATIYLNNVTLVSNVADDDNNDTTDGGGIYNDDEHASTIHIRNSILANNFHRSTLSLLPLPDDCKGEFLASDYNLFETLTGCTVIGSTIHDIIGQDPQLGPLQNNGGTTQTHSLNNNSPAVDAGDAAGCADHIEIGGLLTTDQRGAPRHFDGDGNGSKRCDMGAFEYGGGATNPTPTATKTPTNPLPTATRTPTNPPPTATKTATKPLPTATKTLTNQPPATATHTPTSSSGCTTKPGKPVLLTPPDFKTVNKVNVKLDWEDVPCATKYLVKVMQDGKAGILADKKTVTVSKHKTATLAVLHAYYWFVKACNDHGCAKSITRTFTIPAKP